MALIKAGSLKDFSVELLTSTEPRGLALKALELEKGFDGFLRNLFHPTKDVYFIAWAWDLSGKPIFQYPGVGFSPEDVLIRLKTGTLREFIGEGIDLFPKRIITGGITIRIHLFESEEKLRNFGKILSETTEVIQKSKLNQILSSISEATGITSATTTLVEEAATELAKLVGGILEKHSDAYADFFEGYYASDEAWKAGEETYDGSSSKIILTKY